ncbi:hypothetical protein M23134_01030 [Microscilla marina ATCC 23134]|uniref:Uncharacterized protein n=1 Tax=Microscilla marina ATCC 23134 TaxID=313606 RepID=A1ZFD2_MICM2|nr:hypothetical protein M23134_01030 [Microscilla marina ATCC 23134]
MQHCCICNIDAFLTLFSFQSFIWQEKVGEVLSSLVDIDG